MREQQLNNQVNLFGTLWVLMLANHSLRVEEVKKGKTTTTTRNNNNNNNIIISTHNNNSNNKKNGVL